MALWTSISVYLNQAGRVEKPLMDQVALAEPCGPGSCARAS